MQRGTCFASRHNLTGIKGNTPDDLSKKGMDVKIRRTGTQKVLEANRENSQKSTGPQTGTGKAATGANSVASIQEMVARNMAGSREYNCETLMGNAALHVSPEFAPHIRAVLTVLPFDITEKLMDLKLAFLAVGKSIKGLEIDLPPTIHAHLTPGPHPHLNLHTHPGGKLLYLSPLLLDTSKEQIRFTIAHEIAHAVLGHTEDFSENAQDIAERQERDADELAQGWGFKRPPTVQAA